MTPDRLQQVKEIYLAALDCEPAQRTTFLAAACAGDETLRAEVEDLLAAQAEAESFLEIPAINLQAKLTAQVESAAIEGSIFGDYHLLSLLGKGGMGEVYLAQDTLLERQVALKFLPAHLIGDAGRVKRFKQEALLAAALNHPNIVTIYEVDRAATPRYIATEYVEGETLRQRLERGPLDVREALAVATQIAAALKAAHAKGIIHRDIKPENIMLSHDGLVKVLDFGIAKLLDAQEPGDANELPQLSVSVTRSGLLGTPGYMSPEQVRREFVDKRTDIFSFGVLLYEMLSGQAPFTGENADEMVNAILNHDPLPLLQVSRDAPVELEELVSKALSKDAASRHQTAAELQTALRRLLENVETAIRQHEQAQADLERDESSANPLLSEFDGSARWQALMRLRPQGIFPALLAFAGGLLAVLLSRYVGAACVRVAFETDCGVSLPPVLFGYVVELNAGVLYLFGLPLVVMAGFRLVTMAYLALRLLVASERLTVVDGQAAGESATPFGVIAARNRRVFRKGLPLYIVFAVVMVYGFEYPTWNNMAFGWVQAWRAQDLRGADLRMLQQQKILSPLPETASLLQSNCVVRVIQVSGGHSQAERQRWLLPHLAFVALALGLQAAFILFALWVTTKAVFLFVLLIQALLGKSDLPLSLKLDFADPERRFGLGAMDLIHRSLLLMVLFDAVILLLQQSANVPKGTSVYHGLAGWALVGQIMLLLSPLLTLAVILLAPALLLLTLTETAVSRHLEQLETEKAALRKRLTEAETEYQQQHLHDKLEALRRRLELARQQRPWPQRNRVYRWLLWGSVTALALIPFGTLYLKFLEGDTRLLDLVRTISRYLCAICET